MSQDDAIDLSRRIRRDGPHVTPDGRLWRLVKSKLVGTVPRPFASLEVRPRERPPWKPS